MKTLFLALILLGLTIASFSQNNFRDVVHLKNGSIIKGNVTEIIPDKHIKIATADGSIFVYEMSEIDKMSKEEGFSSSHQKSTRPADYSAATSMGKIMISGSSELSYSSLLNERKISYYDFFRDTESISEEYDQSGFNFKSSVAYFIYDGLAVGISIDYETLKYDYEDSEEKESSFMIGPSLVYYFGSSNIKPYIFGEYMFGTSKTEQKEGSTTNDFKLDMNGWAMGAGIAFFMNEHLSLDLGMGYSRISAKPESDNINPDIGIEMIAKGFVLDGGISVYF
ncbi:outer membrane beta-barrel protein [Marinilabilia salmonicolor]|jgi:opacity protein-like surface antigen|uniref:Outer membrane protein with beta-barrel domain n=1 Tax=Marinilabilia salmonicolor TaxID=989 RepID=A0A2T0XLI7_9BACT|nr:outer membrane beta-barrel protein [Marinilabilia salmonicolor]PRY99741.1 outer membrane protein with beta-barrel domain [Marinilabilia salmonicolor]RCW37463.1 outer membrane protein with beta-barrel domain [Marinilabilia salmonicolor]